MLLPRFYLLPVVMLSLSFGAYSSSGTRIEYCNDQNGEYRYTTEVVSVSGIGQHHNGFLQIEQSSNDRALKQALLAMNRSQVNQDNCNTFITNENIETSSSKDGKQVARLQFGFDNAHLSPIARQSLNRVAQDLAKQKVALQVEGHTDSVGAKQYNQGLGLERAMNTADVLFFQGVEREKVVMKSYGESKPVATNSTVEGRASNRRVDILLNE
ncbi:OmpA family protein [Vibrio methylphosphonaticus]|uniref:OmpA family protein n=1 Tax=Vibrio methylphosphonaticus TaxID=2946866 RepID=UPI002029D58C|nr:OmpA family protein [Vibrio methylphosphonaticus]MCL9774890.1 OmpA family protein [Vibrio methylphosphonaticus]